jgi:predicted porin
MKRWTSMMLSIAAAAMFALPELASAQALQVFAFGDAGLALQTGLPDANTKNTGATTKLSAQSGAWQASRVGFRGRVKLMDDLEAWYDAATTVNLVTGTIGNTTSATFWEWFDRNAFIGLSSKKYGSLTFGRHPGMVTEALWVTDPLKANNGVQNPNVRFGYLVAPGALALQNFGTNPSQNCVGCSINLDRQSQSVRYIYSNSGFLGMALYGFGGASGQLSRNQYVGVNLGYDSDQTPSHGPQDRRLEGKPVAYQLRLAGAFYTDNGQKAGADPTANVVSLYQYTAGAVVRYYDWKLKVSYSGHSIDNQSFYDNLKTQVAAAGVTYSVGDWDLTAAAYHVYRKTDSSPAQDVTKLYFVPEFYLTKNFWLYAIFDYELYNNAGATGAGYAMYGGTNYGPVATAALAAGQTNSLYVGLGFSFFFNS